jgi:hypothetical protein
MRGSGGNRGTGPWSCGWLQSAVHRLGCVKIRSSKTENFPVITIPDGSAASRVGVARPSSERSSVPHPDEYRSTPNVAPDRLRQIEQRLQNHYYEVPPASEQIAASVLAELRDLENSSSVLPH